MRIGEVGRRTGVSTRMLRYYEQQGLVRPGRHTNGYRDYSDAEVAQVRMIRDLGSAGVPTRFIKIVLDRQAEPAKWTEACDEALAGLVNAQIEELDSKIACLATSREALLEFVRDAPPRRRP